MSFERQYPRGSRVDDLDMSGVRLHAVGKRMLSRSSVTVPTSFGDVAVKLVQLQRGGAQRWKVEYNDVRRLAQEHGLPYLTLNREIEAEVRKHFASNTSADKEK